MIFSKENAVAKSSGRAAWLPASLLLVVSVLGTATLSVLPSDAPGAPVAAVFPPWWSAERSFAAAASAGGAIVREGAWSNILVVTPGEGDFTRRLYAAGAWLLVDPKALDACLKDTT
jgi:hypothetical protein